jgi:choline dehydrogenase-like flavoprotein
VSALERVVGNAQLQAFDAIVIGSGAGGAVAAWALADRGASVLVLEAGPNYFRGLADADGPAPLFSNDEIKFAIRGLLDPHVLAEPRTFRTDPNAEAKVHPDVNRLPRTVGGAGVHADLKYVRFHPQDFRLGRLRDAWAGTAFADWPLTYDELAPLYAECERRVGVQGQRDATPFDAPRAEDFPMPPGARMYNHVLLGEAAGRLGYHPFPYPTAVNSRPYDGRPACVDCGFCSGYGCPSNAKGSPAVTWLRAALRTGRVLLRSETTAVRLQHDGVQVTGVDCVDPEGARVTYRAPVYVLAASPIEDARLLLVSDGLGNSSGLVGRHLMCHYQTYAVGLFRQRIHGHRGRAVTGGLLDFRGDADDPEGHPLGGIIEMSAVGPEPVGEAQRYALGVPRPRRGAALAALMKASPLRDHLAALLMQGEDAPQAENRVDLDPTIRDVHGLPVARVTYRNHAFERHASQFYGPKMLEVLRAAGASWGFVAPTELDPPSTRHVMGTLRMGSDPASSVTDAFGRFHGVGNLYCADGALFPTGSGINPVATIQALALRVGRGIATG